MNIKKVLESVAAGTLSVEEAVGALNGLPYEDIGFAKLDHHRQIRTGFPEVIFCEGKTAQQVRDIAQKLYVRSGKVLGTRATTEQYSMVRDVIPTAVYSEQARTITATNGTLEKMGLVAVCTGGTADIPVAEEAAITAEMCGANVIRVYDVGVAGLHRLLSNVENIGRANAIVAVAGMEGALPSVLAGLVDRPVVAVPTSVGYGASFGGLSALLTMINSCAAGIGVVNIDNGFGGGYLAAQMNRVCTQERGGGTDEKTLF